MVEINNQRRRSRYAGVVGGNWITDVKTRNHGYDVIVGGELFTDYSDHPRKLVTLNPNSNQQAPDATSFFPVGGMPASSLAWKTSLRKSQDAVALQQIKERGALPMIDRGDIRQAIDRCSKYLGFTAGRWLVVSSSIRLTAWLQKFKEAGGTVREIDVWAESPRLFRSGYLHHRLPVRLLIITVITPLPTKPSATKMPENWKLANAAITDMQMRQRDVAALDAKYTKELADAKAENDALRWCRWSSSVASKQSVSQSRSPPPPAWIMQPPRLADTAERDYFTSERGWSLVQTTGRNPEVY